MSNKAKKEGGAPTEKQRKIAIGATVAGVLLLFFLLIVLIIQFVQIGVKNNRKRELDRLIEAQQETLDDKVKELNRDDLLFWAALKNGYYD